mgnify:CR=1 FL=1
MISVLPAPISCYAEDLAFTQFEGDIVEQSVLTEVFDFQDYFAGFVCASGVIFGNRTADHVADYLFHIGFAGGFAADSVAVAHYGDGIAVGEYFFHSMRDVDDGNAFVFKRVHYGKQFFCFTFCQGGRRFIHDDDFGIKHQVTHDFCHLLLTNAAFACFCVKRQCNTHLTAFFFGQPAHFFEVKHSETVGYVLHTKTDFRDREIGPDIKFLMDESDAAFFGFECVFEAYFPSVDADRASVGFMDTRKDVHKGGFTGAVFTHQSVDLS